MHRTHSFSWATWPPILVIEAVLVIIVIRLVFGLDIGHCMLLFMLALLLVGAGVGVEQIRERRRAEAEERYQAFSASLEGMDEVARRIKPASEEEKYSER
ncbi:hypothetical protein J2129_001625 [Methanofollis sp. W23]|uniref:hypothetical protein n=1 Tax=Methanofollis sp. W23 TaxID=2817849 RepID=UPI001AE51452|nr:hypothetical protein [Methanofollis sp. W23]MBP2146171.1 hypothetical protein [Methanofollis sp. W23]